MRHIFGSAYMQVYILHSFFIQLTFFHHKSYVEMIDLFNANRSMITYSKIFIEKFCISNLNFSRIYCCIQSILDLHKNVRSDTTKPMKAYTCVCLHHLSLPIHLILINWATFYLRMI